MKNVKLAVILPAALFALLVQTECSASFGDVLLELTAEPGFGASVDVSEGLVIVASGSRRHQQFNDSVAVIDAKTGDEFNRLFPNEQIPAFGTSVDIEGKLAIVGAVASTTALNQPGDDLGSAHVFDVDSGEELWTLRPDDAKPGQRFGQSVALVRELDLALVGAPRDDELRLNGGAVYVFDLETGKQLRKITTEVERPNRGVWTLLGSSIAVDGIRAAFGELNSEVVDRGTKGAVQLFDLETFTPLRKFTNPESAMFLHDGFGLGIGLDGDRLVVGASGLADGCPDFFEGQLGVCNSGGAFVFDVNTGDVLHKLSPPQLEQNDFFGIEVAVDDNTAVIGSQNKGRAVYLFDIVTGELDRRLSEEVGFGTGGAQDRLAIDAGTVVIGAPANHSVFVVDGRRNAEGDLNRDGLVDAIDLEQLFFAIRSESSDPLFDLMQDGVVDFNDLQHWVRHLKGTYFGDANLDGEFSSRDLVQMFQASKFEKNIMAGWSEGDFNGDERFTSTDLVVAFQDRGYENGPRAQTANIPEPSGRLVMLIGVIAIVRRRSY